MPNADDIMNARERGRRSEAARLAAMAISPRLTSAGYWAGEWLDHPIAPETSERYRWLIAAMGIARGTAGGLAIARLASRGYAIRATPSFARLPSVLPLHGAGAGDARCRPAACPIALGLDGAHGAGLRCRCSADDPHRIGARDDAHQVRASAGGPRCRMTMTARCCRRIDASPSTSSDARSAACEFTSTDALWKSVGLHTRAGWFASCRPRHSRIPRPIMRPGRHDRPFSRGSMGQTPDR